MRTHGRRLNLGLFHKKDPTAVHWILLGGQQGMKQKNDGGYKTGKKALIFH
jgi:hypothetical protein